MTIAYLSGKDPITAVGGHSSYVLAHARAAVAAGYRPEIFCVGKRAAVRDTPDGRIHTVASPLTSLRQPTMAFHAPFLGRALERFLISRPAPLLVHSFGPWGYVGASVRRRLERRRLAVTTVTNAYATLQHDWQAKLRGLSPADGRFLRLRYEAESLWIRAVAGRCELQGYRDSRLILVNYESVRRLLVEAGIRAEIRRVPYASATAFGELPADGTKGPVPAAIAALEPATAPLIVVLARHDPRKNLGLLLRCLGDLESAGVPFRACFVGPGTLLERHRQLAAELGLLNRSVAVVGWVEDPFAYLRLADLVVLPSLEEGSGSVALLEALQAGCAVIASNCDGIPEDLDDGISALLVPPGDAAALGGALTAALGDPALRDRLARNGRRTFEARFSPAGLVASLSGLYAELGFGC